jgi:hypothetical protein
LHDQLHPLVPPVTTEGDDTGDDVFDMHSDHKE